MTILIVQCRLSSTRLPQKALKNLGNKPVLAWTLNAMHKVPADEYIVATDESSVTGLSDVVKKCGWNIFIGPEEDVLKRFCLVIEKYNADIVIRATADNPFLFYESAVALLEEYKRHSKISKCDYITWTGLPHGSGIEIFNAKSLLKAAELTKLPYDHEHVGPALYNHKDKFESFFIESPSRWNYPLLRTTIDTIADYRHALLIVEYLSKENITAEPYTTEQIVSALESNYVQYPVLLMPSIQKGHGTGHIKRCLSIAIINKWFIYIPENSSLKEINILLKEAKIKGFENWQIVREFPQKDEYTLVITDLFVSSVEILKKIRTISNLAVMDEGSKFTCYADYILDIIPSLKKNRMANFTNPNFISLPSHIKNVKEPVSSENIKKILITVGGEDPLGVTALAAIAFALPGKEITAICFNKEKNEKIISEQSPEISNHIIISGLVPNLKETLADYDLIITHYGFTAFEAIAAGCGVLLLGTTPLHSELAQKYGFFCLQKTEITRKSAEKILKKKSLLYPSKLKSVFNKSKKSLDSLALFLKDISYGKRIECPVCGKKKDILDPVVFRTKERTFRRCSECGILYMSWTKTGIDTEYDVSYFNESYKIQYGKTYIEDFPSIKAQCVRRMSVIDAIYRKRSYAPVMPSVLDIGCAYGPFLDAASDAGWQVFGTDISQNAVDYVQKKLLFPAAISCFPDFEPSLEFGISKFDSVTMWYVIEHFTNLKSVLEKVSLILKLNGIFAFSTPSASGVSAKKNRENFFTNSPADHYTLFELKRVNSLLAEYGFKVIKILSTGHHPERFPKVSNKKSLRYRLASFESHIFKLGDTFEVYCKKIKECKIER